MNHQITSRFSITSERFNSELVSTCFPWEVIERNQFSDETKPGVKTDFHFTACDLDLGADGSLRVHPEKATDELMKYLQTLEDLQWECDYTLWLTDCSFSDWVFESLIRPNQEQVLRASLFSLLFSFCGI